MGSLFPGVSLLLVVALLALTPQLPSGLPTAAARLGWERLDGVARQPDVEVEYELLVNPARSGLYEIARYQLTRIETGADGRPRRVREPEKLVWNPDPGRAPLRAFALVTRRPWWLLGIVQRRHWVEVPHGSPRYREEMLGVIRVYGLPQSGTPR